MKGGTKMTNGRTKKLKTIEYRTFSIRVSKKLYRMLEIYAIMEEMSVNKTVNYIVTKEIGNHEKKIKELDEFLKQI